MGRLYPQSRVIYVTHGEKGALAERVLRLDAADVESGWHHLFADPEHLPDRPAALVAGAHHVVTFLTNLGDRWCDNVQRLAPEAKVTPLRLKPPEGYREHVSDHLLQQLEPDTVLHAAATQMLRS